MTCNHDHFFDLDCGDYVCNVCGETVEVRCDGMEGECTVCNKGQSGQWQTCRVRCFKCEYQWQAVAPVQAEYYECPNCHTMTPAPYIAPAE